MKYIATDYMILCYIIILLNYLFTKYISPEITLQTFFVTIYLNFFFYCIHLFTIQLFQKYANVGILIWPK